jgi:hypothetical protein
MFKGREAKTLPLRPLLREVAEAEWGGKNGLLSN